MLSRLIIIHTKMTVHFSKWRPCRIKKPIFYCCKISRTNFIFFKAKFFLKFSYILFLKKNFEEISDLDHWSSDLILIWSNMIWSWSDLIWSRSKIGSDQYQIILHDPLSRIRSGSDHVWKFWIMKTLVVRQYV